MTTAKISYNEDDVNRSASKKRLYKDTWYPFAIKQAEAKVSEGGHYMIVTQNAPLLDADDVNSTGGTQVRDNWVLPFDNKDVDEQEPPNTGGICTGKVRALFGPDVVPYFPRRDKNKRLMFKGEEIDPDTEAACRKEVTKAAFDKLIELYENPSELINHVFYGRVKHEGDFDNIDRMSHELPPNAKKADPDNFVDNGGVADAKAAAGKSARRKRPTKKK